MEICGKTIKKIYQGPLGKSKGVDMPGIAGPTWYYANLFLQLDTGSVIFLSVGNELGNVVKLPSGATATKDKELKTIEGKRSIVNIYHSNEELISYVLLDDGSHIEYSYQPGGSYWGVDRFDEWSDEDLEDDQWEDTFTSIIDGETLSWSQLAKWYNK